MRALQSRVVPGVIARRLPERISKTRGRAFGSGCPATKNLIAISQLQFLNPLLHPAYRLSEKRLPVEQAFRGMVLFGQPATWTQIVMLDQLEYLPLAVDENVC